MEALIRRLFEAQGLVANYRNALAQTIEYKKAELEGIEGGDELILSLTELMTGMVEELIDKMVPIYAKVYNEVEIEAILAFYESEIGRAMVAKAPIATANLVPHVVEWQESIDGKVEAKVEEFLNEAD